MGKITINGVLTIYTLLYMDNFPSQTVKLPEGNPQKDGATIKQLG